MNFATAQDKNEPVAADFTKVKFNATGQTWFFYQQKDAPKGDDYTSFRIRRMELRFSGQINDWIKYNFMIDPARLPISSSVLIPTNVNIIQDLYAEFIPLENLHVNIGQFKYPFTYEGLLSSARLAFVERAELSRVFGDNRQLGIMAHGEFLKEDKTPWLGYQVGVFDGNSQNSYDLNREKDLVARLYTQPFKELHIGASGYLGRSNNISNPQDRIGVEAVYDDQTFKIMAEAADIIDSTDGPKSHQLAWYAAALYKINSVIEPGVRFEYDDNNLEVSQGSQMLPGLPIGHIRATAGINFHLSDKTPTKIQVNYLWVKNGNYVKNPGQTNNLLMVNTQVGF